MSFLRCILWTVRQENGQTREVMRLSKGEWLLRHYNEFKSRTEVLTVRLNQLKTELEKERSKDEWIMSASLGTPSAGEYVKGHGFNSRTEMIALNCESAVNSELDNEKKRIIHEISELEYCTQLCESILQGLTESERWIIKTRFTENKTLDAMVECQPQGLFIFTRQTMSKRCKLILNRIDHILYDLDLPKDLYDETEPKQNNK